MNFCRCKVNTILWFRQMKLNSVVYKIISVVYSGISVVKIRRRQRAKFVIRTVITISISNLVYNPHNPAFFLRQELSTIYKN